ncbi:glucose-1-phosphate cytidylyltransferase [Euzebya tangerina]|uniref:glucose-1-phosphate cytidylyltransferase n=1 Tax=Euzebya tangerina TaxID=591198 RepID=UPI000E3187B2|nr:glucose-1-phosphate cytidylyltransferase [Euzebya tangerina]
MRVGILAGGLGTRLAEETEVKPKPMVEIGGRPIMWHIMKYYASFDHTEFAVALGYKGDVIKRWLLEYASLASNLTVNLGAGKVTRHEGEIEDWEVTLVDTGLPTATGGRIKQLVPYLAQDGTFMLTWGDGVSDVDLDDLLAFHRSHGKLVTMTAVRPPARFGHMTFDGDAVSEFSEKPQTGEGWINGAFFVMEPEVANYIDGDDTQFELEPMIKLAKDGELMAYRHYGFWQCMDTIRDKKRLEQLWVDGPVWKVW